MAAPHNYTAFFYGTLMVPAVLTRVIQSDGSDLQVAPAILLEHTRHQVKGMDYPGVVPYAKSREIMDRDLTPDERSVRGVVVQGLSKTAVQRLHDFEGMAYDPVPVSIHLLSTYTPLVGPGALTPQELLSPSFAPALPTTTSSETLPDLAPPIAAMVYMWTAPTKWLTPELWSFDLFLKERLRRWVEPGAASETNGEQPNGDGQEVEWNSDDEALERDALEAREKRDREKAEQEARNGGASQEHLANGNGRFVSSYSAEEYALLIRDIEAFDTIPPSAAVFPKFGHPMKSLFGLDKDYLNINSGSYGTTPLPISLAAAAFSQHIESNPDWFIRRELEPMILATRQKLAPVVGCKDVDELVLVQGASIGLASILWNLKGTMGLGDGDVIVELSITYDSIRTTLKFMQDTTPGLSISTLDLTFPLSHKTVLRRFKAHLETILSSPAPSAAANPKPKRIIAIIDTVSSNPGIRFPWEDMVKICRELGVFSIVDGAHGVGLVPLELDHVDPDAFVSNCHKWMSSKRASAFLYVPKRNHHLFTSTFPVSEYYTTSTPNDPPTRFALMHNWTGTQDFAPILSIAWAINFRRAIGGEARIQEYCRTLALDGGRLMAKIWGTQVMDDMTLEDGETWAEDGELTTAMVNILLPLQILPSQTSDQLKTIYRRFQDAMLARNFYLPIMVHGSKESKGSYKEDQRRWWARASAQLWLEISDFEKVARMMLDICTEVQKDPGLFSGR
ncbi:PLP-dependent transferase [Clavulina sp. PMI_390]|nr:PLP-dependent transferase [Clavulina sp. PMI_390]